MTEGFVSVQAIIDADDLPCFALDRELRYTAFNRAHAVVMRALNGADIALGGRLPDYQTVAADRETSTANLERALAGEHFVASAFSGEEGKRRYFDVVHTPQTDETGAVVGVVVRASDVTERKRAEGALRESEQDFRVLAEAVPQIVWTTDPDGKNTYFNQQWVDYTGMTLEESRGDGWNEPFHPDDRQRAWDAWQRATREDAPYSLECRLRRADGAYRWWLVRGAPQRDAGGTIVKWFGTCTDIEDIKQAEEALREREYLFSASQRAAHVGTWSWQVGDATTYWSDETYRLYGLSPEMGPPSNEFFFEIVHPDDRQKTREFPAALIAGLHPPPFDCRVRRSDGTYRTIRTVGDVVETVDGVPSRIAGTAHDVTERKRAEEQLAQKTRLYATLSQVNQTIVRAKEPSELYQGICDVAVEFGEFTLAWVGLLDEASGDVRPVAANGVDVAEWPFETVNIHKGVSKDGLVATAIRSHEVAITGDVESDEKMRSVLGQVEGRDYHSIAAIPFGPGGRAVGVLVLVSQRSGLFMEASEVGLLKEMGTDVSFALDAMATEAERERADEGLRESEERFSTVFRSSGVGMALTRLSDSRFADVNGAFCALLGFSREQMIGHTSDELDIWRDSRQRRESSASVQATGHSMVSDAVMRTKSGETRHVLLTSEIITVAGERYVLSGIQDITERTQAEEQLADQAARLKMLADASREFAEAGKDYRAVLDQVTRQVTETLADVGLVRLLSDDGESIELAAMYGLDPDLSEALRALEAPLSLSAEDPALAPAVFRTGEPALVPVVTMDQIRASVPPEHWSVYERIAPHSYVIVQLRVQGQGIGVLTLIRRRPERPPFTAADVSLAQDLADRAAMTISNARLLDEIKHLNAELEERVESRTAELEATNKELEAFAYSVSHDLRAPLRHISGYAGILRADSQDALDEDGRQCLDTISESAREMGVLIDDLLQFSRIGRAEMKVGDVDVAAVLEEALAPIRQEAQGRAIEWSLAPLPHAFGDPALLRQVWSNLLENAVKYTRDRDPARIEVGVVGDEAASARGASPEQVFFVRDNGVGFDMQYAHKLFGVFQRLHNSAEFEGTGIGLANVQRIVTRHGGRVWAEAAVDEGATFFFALPRRKRAP